MPCYAYFIWCFIRAQRIRQNICGWDREEKKMTNPACSDILYLYFHSQGLPSENTQDTAWFVCFLLLPELASHSASAISLFVYFPLLGLTAECQPLICLHAGELVILRPPPLTSVLLTGGIRACLSPRVVSLQEPNTPETLGEMQYSPVCA